MQAQSLATLNHCTFVNRKENTVLVAGGGKVLVVCMCVRMHVYVRWVVM